MWCDKSHCFFTNVDEIENINKNQELKQGHTIRTMKKLFKEASGGWTLKITSLYGLWWPWVEWLKCSNPWVWYILCGFVPVICCQCQDYCYQELHEQWIRGPHSIIASCGGTISSKRSLHDLIGHCCSCLLTSMRHPTQQTWNPRSRKSTFLKMVQCHKMYMNDLFKNMCNTWG